MTDLPVTKVRRRSAASERLAEVLERVRGSCDVGARRALDPVGAVHAFSDPIDQEIVGLVAACIAFGNVKTIRAKLTEALARIGPSPATAGDHPAALRERMRGWKHRVFIGDDLAGLVIGARAVQRQAGTLGARFKQEWDATADLREALARFTDAIRDAGNLHACAGGRRGPAHLLGNPRAGSGNKRLLLYLRWMVRPADGIDLGLWPLPASILLCPVDTHIHKLARNLGFTRRRDLGWRTVVEIGGALARLDPADPARYDFALCHLGMLQRCPSRRDEARCEGCGVMPVCRHWAKRSAR